MPVNQTYFIGKRHIGQLSAEDVRENLNYYIEKFTKHFWLKYLGYALYREYLADKTAQRFKNLLDGGIEFNYNGTTYIFEGINEAIADLVYYHFVRDDATSSSGSGMVVPKNENSKNVSSLRKLTDVYNDMISRLHMMQKFLEDKAEDYPEYVCKKIESRINTFNL